MPRKKITGQDEHGRIYRSQEEFLRASGNMIEINIILQKEEPKIGTVLMYERWLYGGANFAHMGPKKWTNYFLNNFDKITEGIEKHFRKDNKTTKLIGIQGWRITTKKLKSLAGCIYFPSISELIHNTEQQ